MKLETANPLVRCGFCPGATPAVRRVSHGLCPCCVAREQLLVCPQCRGRIIVDPTAGSADGSCVVAFCSACEFALELGDLT